MRTQNLWMPLARGWALFLGLFLLLDFLGLHASEWVLNFVGVPLALSKIVTATSALALLTFGFAPNSRVARSSLTAIGIGLALAMALFNVWQFYQLLWVGWISTLLPVPLSLFTAALLASVLWALRKAPKTSGGHAFSIAHFAGALVLFPMAQMIFFGATDYSCRADAIVVFGARTYNDGRPSDALADRVRTACDLYKAGLAPVVVMSGGPGDGAVHETEAMRAYAILHGVPASAIVSDRDGLNTAATLRNVDALARTHHWRRVLAVSHGYHLPRVKLTSQRRGLDLYTTPARSPEFLAKLPYFMARETAGWWVYFFREQA